MAKIIPSCRELSQSELRQKLISIWKLWKYEGWEPTDEERQIFLDANIMEAESDRVRRNRRNSFSAE